MAKKPVVPSPKGFTKMPSFSVAPDVPGERAIPLPSGKALGLSKIRKPTMPQAKPVKSVK